MGQRTDVPLTDTWQKVADGRAVFTIKTIDASRGQLQVGFNEAPSDDASLLAVAKSNYQIQQNEHKATYAKGAGVTITVDEA